VLEDNGAGLPAGFKVEMDAGLGLNLVRTLVEKDLHGEFQLERRAQWTRAVMRFQLDEE
jgi:two-component sensor histidine kinase